MHILVYFINNNMTLNIKKEYNELTKIINVNMLDLKEHAKRNYISRIGTRINYLWAVLKLTSNNPQVELYLKDLLNYFTIDELENTNNCWSILHRMCHYSLNISLNAFEIIINYGINVNIKNSDDNTAAHILLMCSCYNNNRIYDFLNLFIKCGADLNIKNYYHRTLLDTMTYHTRDFDEEVKNSIMLIIDFGGITNNLELYRDNEMMRDFIEYYKCLNIKPAIKK